MGLRRFREGRRDQRRIEDVRRLKEEYLALPEAELRCVILALRAEVKRLQWKTDYATPVATLFAGFLGATVVILGVIGANPLDVLASFLLIFITMSLVTIVGLVVESLTYAGSYELALRLEVAEELIKEVVTVGPSTASVEAE